MYFNSILRKGTFVILLGAFAFTGCQKSSRNVPANEDDNGGYAADISAVEWASEDAMSIVDAAGFFYNGAYMKSANKTTQIGNCAIVSTDTLSSPRTLTIRFGSTNCECLDGRNRRGAIIVNYDGDFKDTLKVKTITFDNYYVNDRNLTGTINVTRVDTTIIGNWYYRVKTDVAFANTSKQYITWKGNLVRKWREGFNTGDRGDNIYSVSGSATLTRTNGHVFACDIATPLYVAMNCDYIRYGLINVNAYEGVRLLDYSLGNGSKVGECDDYAQVTVNGHIYQVRL